ncbi:hypothetical protein SporoP37_00180 [Sporosarcina sp. P37]|uniref:hypothetical protein n=1 Tax=unclassified Sporosarcina TaxID=2647733 RepID=UPI000A17E6DC|nr:MULTISPECIES: hypothetical protein [unclassified Sporosarcina]ARK23258.1 hypothetical protein SporoP37_00180 [Sporosarcina sp. P37]PID19509.1 hypothetical protein CSV62_03130 [Sporosarcina sp. P35]
MIKHKVKIKRNKTEHNKFIRNNVINYLKYSTPRELIFDIVAPLFIALIVATFAAYLIPTPRDFAIVIQDLNSITITITAILAGFNTASLAIIASSSSLSENKVVTKAIPEPNLKGLNKIKNLILNNPTKKEIDAVISFFAYAVISQLLILVISLIINVLLTSMLKIDVLFPNLKALSKYWILISCSTIWIFLILHSIFLSIRNIDMISHFVKYNSKQ